MLDWPKSFGDVMPLEIVWKKMGDEFSKGNIKATDEKSLWREIELMWQTLCKDVFIVQLIKDIPSKLSKIKQCGGVYYDDQQTTCTVSSSTVISRFNEEDE